jgi:penicillin amidase
VRIVVDVGAWDNSLCINAPGQSGNPTSKHYGDLAEKWARGAFVPMLYSREKVDAATKFRIILAGS